MPRVLLTPALATTEAGADIVVGTHAHRLRGMGCMGDRFVADGLSNFVGELRGCTGLTADPTGPGA